MTMRTLGRILTSKWTMLVVALVAALCAPHDQRLLIPFAIGATFDLTAADAMLKVVSDDAMFDSIVTFSQVIDLFEQNSNVTEGPTGRYVELSNMFGGNEAVGARSESGFLPVPGNPTFVNGRIKLKKTLAVSQMTWDVMKQAVRSKAAFADWADVELTKTERAMRDDLDRQAIGYGAGILCRIANVAFGTNQISLKDPYGFANTTKGWLPGIRRGMSIVAGPNVDGSGLRNNGEAALVLSVDKKAASLAGVLTLDHVPGTWANSDYLFKGDDLGSNAPVNGIEVEMIGLEGLIDDGTNMTVLQNIDRTLYPEWKSQVTDASASPYSGLAKDTLFMQMNDDVIELGGSTGLTHICVTRAVFRNIYVQIRGTAFGGFGAALTPEDLRVGAKGIKVWLGDRQVEIRGLTKLFPGRAFGIDRSVLRRFHLQGIEWEDITGSIWKQVAVGSGIKDAFYAYCRNVMELACSDPQKCAKASGLSEAQA